MYVDLLCPYALAGIRAGKSADIMPRLHPG